MIKNFSNEKTPVTEENWRKMNEEDRIDRIYKCFDENESYKEFKVLNAPDNGQIVLQIERLIPANERGIFLLDLENLLILEEMGGSPFMFGSNLVIGPEMP